MEDQGGPQGLGSKKRVQQGKRKRKREMGGSVEDRLEELEGVTEELPVF